MSDTERIERLETIVRALNEQLAALRSEVASLRGVAQPAGMVAGRGLIEPAREPPPARAGGTERRDSPATRPAAEGGGRISVPPAPPAAPRGAFGGAAPLDIEALIGRYGTIALATLALLAGMGAFLTWAISHGLLGPTPRVVLGAIGAAAVAGVGWWLRSRGTARFGNTLLALALALLHLDLWAAGPRLHVIPPTMALVVIAAASVALAWLALRTEEELLFCVGLGGALLAPFVASTGGGSAPILASYGWLVIAAAIAAIATRDWRFAIAITGIGCFVYAAATEGLLRTSSPWVERAVPALFALACAWAALAWGLSAVRARLALGFLLVGAGALFATTFGRWGEPTAVVLGFAGSITALAAPRRGETPDPWSLVARVVLPVGFLLATLTRLDDATSIMGTAVALAWFALSCIAVRVEEEERGLHFITACVVSAIAIGLALSAHAVLCIVALSVHVALSSLLMRERDQAGLVVPVSLVLAVAALWAYALLIDRTAYAYTPFVTTASVAALAATLATWTFARCAATLRGVSLEVLAPLPAIVAFVWLREELARAYSPDISAFLLILFYALTGIAAIFYGRRHSHAPSRAVGLALACYAALDALVHAWGLSAIGLRVGACILAGAFIALVAYWYRGEEGGEGESREQKPESSELPRG